MTAPGDEPAHGDPLAGAIGAARASLEGHAREINDLNVFPVADGDTGTNMLLTVQAVEVAAQGLMGTSTADRCEALARAAVLGARGNSGFILSQMVRGAADVIADAPLLDGPTVAQALRGASDRAYATVPNPVEGTMLTVIRGMAEGAEAADSGTLQQVLTDALAAGRASLAATEEMLPQLREAGVVDSGAYGVLLIVEGLAAALMGRRLGPSVQVAAPAVVAHDHEPSAFRFCTSYVLDDATIELAELEAALHPLGDSLLVIGDRRQAKVHLHTDEPQRAIALGEAAGVVSGVNVDDMHKQEEERAARIARRAHADKAAATGTLDPALVLTATNTALVTDSAADLPPKVRGNGLVIVPFPVSFGAESFRDGVDLDADEFYARLTTGGQTPTTAAPSLGELIEIYTAALATHDYVLGLHMNRKMSATVEIARRAALEVDPDRVIVIETESVSFQLGLLVRRAQAYLAAGTTLGAIEDLVDTFRRTNHTVFTIETLEYLRRGGRIGLAKALIGNLLGLRPLLEIAGGEVTPVRRVRGADKVFPAMREFLVERSDADRPLRVVLGHARAPESIPALDALVREARPKAVIEMVAEIGPTVGTHSGPGTVAFTFFHDPIDEAR